MTTVLDLARRWGPPTTTESTDTESGDEPAFVIKCFGIRLSNDEYDPGADELRKLANLNFLKMNSARENLRSSALLRTAWILRRRNR